MEPGTDEQSVVLEEEIDENYEPTEDEIREYAGWLGMDLKKEKDLLWIASEGLKAPLPEDWKPCRSPDGDIYYFNFSTGESVWDHPCDDYYRKLYQDEKEKKKKKEAEAPTPSTSVGAARPVSTSSKTFQAPQKLSALDSIPGLRRKDDPFKMGSTLRGQGSPSEEKPAATATSAKPAASGLPGPAVEEERRAKEQARDKELRDSFTKQLEAEREAWEDSQRANAARKKQEIKESNDAEVEACKRSAEEFYSKEKAACEAKVEKYRDELSQLYRKEENVLRKLHDQKISDLEKELKKEEGNRLQKLELQMNELVAEAEKEHDKKAEALKSQNESALKELEVDLQLVSKTCSQKIEDLVKQKEEKEKKFAEEIAALESEHLTNYETKKLELEGEFQMKIEELTMSNERAFKNKEMIKSTFAEEQQKLEETVKQRVDEERRKNESILEEELNKLQVEKEEKLKEAKEKQEATLKEEREKQEATLKEELQKLEEATKLRIKEAQESNQSYVNEELQCLRSSRAETLAEGRVQQDDQYNQMMTEYEEKLKKAEEDAEKRLGEKFKELEQKHLQDIEEKEKELSRESDLRVEKIKMDLKSHETECKQDMEAKKARMKEVLDKEMSAHLEEEKKKCLDSLAQEIEEFKSQERLKLLAAAKEELEAEAVPEDDTGEESEEESTTSSTTESQSTRAADVTPPLRSAQNPPQPMFSLDAPEVSHDVLLAFLKEQKQFLQQRQNALHKAREDWKVHVRASRERKESGLPWTNNDEVALSTARYTLEAQSRMLNEDTRNYRLLKQEIEKSILKSRSGTGKENMCFSRPVDVEEDFAPLRAGRSGAKPSLKNEKYEMNNLQHARKFVSSMSSGRRSYEKRKYDRQHGDALNALSGHAKWLTNFKSKLSTLSSKANHNQRVASALNRLRNKELVIRISQ